MTSQRWNRRTVVLAATTVLFVVASLGGAFALQWQGSRLAAPSHRVEANAPPHAVPGPALPIAAGTRAGAPSSSMAKVGGLDPRRGSGRPAEVLALARHQLAELRDPQARALRARHIAAERLFSEWEWLGPQIGLSPAELAAFLETSTQRGLQRREAELECHIDPSCDILSVAGANSAADHQDEVDLLGSARHALMQAVQASGGERAFAAQLNRRLPADQVLSRATIDQLTLALADELVRVTDGWQRNGLFRRGFPAGDNLSLFAASVPDSAGEFDQLSASARQYAKRRIDRAAGLLTSAQFAEFRAMHDAGLEGYLASMEHERKLLSIRRNAAPANVADTRTKSQRDPVDVAVARYLVERYADPRWRALQAAQLRNVLRDDWDFLGSCAGLSLLEVSQIIELAIEMELAQEQRRHACEADEACDPGAPDQHEARMTDREVLQIVGPEKLARIQTLREAGKELRFVRVLRRLPENRGELSDTDAGRLALAMAEERQRLQREAIQAGGIVDVIGEPFPLYFVRGESSGGRAAVAEQMLETAVAYNARVRARAAVILDGALLTRFEALQEMSLVVHQRVLREQQVREAARAR